MFKIVQQPRAWWPVEFKGVAEDGTVITHKIQIRFIICDEDEHLEMQRDLAKLDAAEGVQSVGAMGAKMLGKIAEDWKDVGEDDGTTDGKSLPFTKENMERLCRVPNVIQGIASAYAACRAGEAKVRSGN